MKQLPLNLAFLLLLSVGCTKIKVERTDPIKPTTIPDTEVSIKDSSFVIVGYHLGLKHQPVNVLLDLSNSAKDYDSTKLFISLGDLDSAISFSVLKSLYFTSDSSNNGISTGVYFQTHDSTILAGAQCTNSFYSYNFRDTINFTNLCSPGYDTPADFFAVNSSGKLLALNTQIIYSQGGSFTNFPWSPNRTGRGYLCLRYLKENLVKYVWIQLEVLSTNAVRIIDYAYQE